MTFKQKVFSYFKHLDYILVLLTIGLSVFGVFLIYSSTNAPSIPAVVHNQFHWLYDRQILNIATGVVMMFIFSAIDFRKITRFYWLVFAFMLVLLLLARFIGADDYTQTARWIRIPVPGVGDMSLQPSEFAKIFMIIFLAKFLEVNKDRFNKIGWLFVVLITIVVPVFLVIEQPSLSAGMVVLSISLIVLFVAGLYWRTILLGLAIITPAAIFVWFDLQRTERIFLNRILGDFQMARIDTFLYPIPGSDAFRQTQGSLFAIGTGGLTGRGWLNNPFVILGHNDFVFAVHASQFGFVGSILLLAAVAAIIIRCIMIALRSPDLQGRLIAAGVAGMMLVETFFHVGVTTNLIPNTGMPFPFVSYGGSMIWVHMIAIGMVLNIKLPRPLKSMFDESEGEQIL